MRDNINLLAPKRSAHTNDDDVLLLLPRANDTGVYRKDIIKESAD